MDLPVTRSVIDDALAAGAFSAISVEVRRAGPVWRYASGRLSQDPDAAVATASTIFDLASLTKVIATTSLLMRHIALRRVSLETSIADVLPAWDDPGHRAITVRHLLDHSSGLAAHGRFWEYAAGRSEYEAAIRRLPLERMPGVAAVYSDPGFILLGFIVERLGGAALDAQFAEWWSRCDSRVGANDMELLAFVPPVAWKSRTAATEFDPWRGRMLVGEVHDENAAALGGVAGHAGIFGTAPGVGQFATLVLRTFGGPTALGSPESMRVFSAKTGVPGSSRALGWDTMLPTSSCGTRLSPTAIGHTGFTGTSLWIDAANDLYVVLLTNRVHPTRQNDRWRLIRPHVHDTIVEELVTSAP